MSFLSAVSFIFSVCSPRSLSFTGRRQKSDAGDGKGRKAEPMAQDRTADRGLPRHSACQCPSRRQNAGDTPSSFTLDCYHGDALFASSVSPAVDADHEGTSSPRQTGVHTHTIFTDFLVVLSSFCTDECFPVRCVD